MEKSLACEVEIIEICKQEDEKPLTSLFNIAFHEGTFQNCNFHVVNNFSKNGRE